MDCRQPGSSLHGFSRQEYWSGLPFPSPGDLRDPRIEPEAPVLAYGFFTPGKHLILFSSVQSLSRVRLFVTPWIVARQASLSITNSQSSLRLTSIESVMPSSHLILCRPLLLLPLIQSQSAAGAVTKYPRLGGINNRRSVSQIWSCQSTTDVSAGLSSGCPSWLVHSLLPCVSSRSILSVCRERQIILSSSYKATSCEELTLWKRLWCWEGLGAGGEGDDRGWDGWMASLIWWTRVWVNSGSWWWTGRPGVLWFMGSQGVGHDWVTELTEPIMRLPY